MFESVKIKRATSLIIVFKNEGIAICNFLQKKSFSCNKNGLEILIDLNEFKSIESVFQKYSNYSKNSIATILYQLIESGAIIIENSHEHLLDENYFKNWEWNVVAGLYHFGIQNSKFLSQEEVIKWLENRKKEIPSPILYQTNNNYKKIIKLKNISLTVGFNKILLKRRSYRLFTDSFISTKELSDCLFSGLGIIGFVEEEPFGKLPIKLTPSGGARNPYEAFILVRKVKNINPGFYHYSALEHNLGFIKTEQILPEKFFGGQEWTNKASAIVFLVANYDRTIWKYSHPNGYRVVLIEAGHITQNMALSAARLGLASSSTGAINDELISTTLGLDPIKQSVPYAFVIGTKKNLEN